MAILLECNETTFNDRRPIDRPSGRRRHLTTINRVSDHSTIPEEASSNQQLNEQQNKQTDQLSQSNKSTHCCYCCHTSKIYLCSTHYHRLPDLIVQHQPVIMSADVHFEQQQSINQIPIDNLASKLALVYTPHWIENDVFLPAVNHQTSCNMNSNNYQFNNQVNNQAINQVNNLLNNQDNSQQQNNHRENKSESCSPRIIRCSLNSALYQYNPRLKAKIMLNARRSASVSLPIDHETLRQVGYSLRMISEQFHLKRLQENALMAEKQQSKNVSLMVKWFCKFLVNKLPSIGWKTNNTEKITENKISPKSSPIKMKSPIKKSDNQLNRNSLNINQLDGNRLNINQSNQVNHYQVNQLINQSDHPDVVPMVHVLIPVRQRCHSTTTDC